MRTNYDKRPSIRIDGWENSVWTGYPAIARQWQAGLAAMGRPEEKGKPAGKDQAVIVVESYPGVRDQEIVDRLALHLPPFRVIRSEHAAIGKAELDRLIGKYMTDDRVFGHMAPFTIDELLDPGKVARLREEIGQAEGLVVVIGFGASRLVRGDMLVYADLSRWEIQLRYRSRELGNWLADNRDEDILRKYKRGYFFEWRVADRLKRSLLPQIDYYLDTHVPGDPKMVSGQALNDGLRQAASGPFRLVPYFDPGVWGGRWLRERLDLPERDHPYAWGFDGVPEENSLYFAYGDVRVELPAINLVFEQPIALLGEKVYARFGAEFPIRFDFLDTIGGQNLSLQVHPSTDYIRQQFGMSYTQDESYYMLDAEPGAKVYLGLKEGVDRERMLADLARAETGELSFPAERYVNVLPAKKHDHFLIPAGTVHCSAGGCMVLEISATPYIFTFKLWDWDRLGLDGRPRPVHVAHGAKVIRWDRTTDWVRDNLVDRVEQVAEGPDWREERTGLHELEFIETRRHWFSGPVRHETHGSVNMLNLVEGDEATVESVDGSFEPFVVHYAETFIIPAAVGEYIIKPSGPSAGKPVATIKAYVRG